jgi:hypothetical protein
MSEPDARLRIPGGNHCLRKFSQIGTPIRLWQKCDEKIYIDNRFDGHDLDLIGRQHAGFQDEQGENHQNHNGPVYGLHANNMRRESPISAAIGFLCPDDEAATKYARQFVDGHDVELWQGDRQIATFDCEAE